MRRPHLSTGAWIAVGLIGAAAIAPAAVYAAASSTVAIGNATGTVTAKVTANHQLLSTPIEPRNVVVVRGFVQGACRTVYTPPAGKAIVVTDMTMTVGSGVEGTESFGEFFGGSTCTTTNGFDQYDGVKAFDTLPHTYPTGLPMPALSVSSVGGEIYVFAHGYLVPTSQLPPAPAAQPDAPSKFTPKG